MEILLAKKSISEKDLDEFEEKIGANFPQAFRLFYLTNNGGVPTHSYYDGTNIQVFAPIKYGDWPMEERHEGYRQANPENSGYVPFGHNGGGDPILINLNKENYGKIYIHHMGEYELDYVAKGFSQFIEGLSEEMDD